MRIPDARETHYMRLLAQGMLPEYDIPKSVRNALSEERWATVGRWDRASGIAYIGLTDDGAAMLQRLSTKEG